MKKIIITLSLILSIHLLRAQNPLVKDWDYRFGGTGPEFINSMIQAADGGYIFGGFSSSATSGDKSKNSWGGFDFWIIKTDSSAIKEWDADFGGTDDDRLYSLQQTTDGGYILGGSSSSGISGDKSQPNWDNVNFSHDFWVVKIDASGNKEWDKDFGGTDNDYLVSISQTADGGYILGGNSVSGISGDKTESNWNSLNFTNDYWIVKIDSQGNKEWDRDFGGTDEDELATVRQTDDGGYLLAGLSFSGIGGSKSQETKGQFDYWIIKTDSLGMKQWDKDFGGSENEILYSMDLTTDGGAILGGVSASGISGDKTQPNWDNSNSSNDYWLVKMDSQGIKQWDKVLGGTDGEPIFGNVSQTLDGGYLASGISYSPISGNKTENNLGIEQTWVVKTNNTGSVQWDKTAFTIAEDECGFAIQTTGGCYLMANNSAAGIGGDKSQEGWGFSDFWVIKFCDTTSAIPTTIDPNLSHDAIKVFPNPFSNEISIGFSDRAPSSMSCKISDIWGSSVLDLKEINFMGTSSKKISLDLLADGIYFLDVNIDGSHQIMKVMKQ